MGRPGTVAGAASVNGVVVSGGAGAELGGADAGSVAPKEVVGRAVGRFVGDVDVDELSPGVAPSVAATSLSWGSPARAEPSVTAAIRSNTAAVTQMRCSIRTWSARALGTPPGDGLR